MDFESERSSDSRPPRYSMESDEDEDEINPLSATSTKHTVPVVELKGDVRPGSPLIIVQGVAAKMWGKMAELGEQVAGVYVNNVQVGMIFRPSWTSAIILLSEITSRLPVLAMHPYALYVLNTLNPSRVSILDAYSPATYISDTHISLDEAPARVLGFGPNTPGTSLKPFSPPNVLSTTSAAFLATAYLKALASPERRNEYSCYTTLLPSLHLPPSSQQVEGVNFAALKDDSEDWSSEWMAIADDALLSGVGEKVTGRWQKLTGHNAGDSAVQKKTKTYSTDGSMYI